MPSSVNIRYGRPQAVFAGLRIPQLVVLRCLVVAVLCYFPVSAGGKVLVCNASESAVCFDLVAIFFFFFLTWQRELLAVWDGC